MKTIQVSAGGIVIRRAGKDIKVLLIKDRFGYWTWPKGHLEKGENLEGAAVREIEEETGIKDLRIISQAGTQKYSFSRGEEVIDKTVHIFLIETCSKGPIKVQVEEISDARWFSPEAAVKKIDYKGARDILKKALESFGTLKD